MMRVASFLALFFVAAIAQQAYICNVLLPSDFGQSVPTITLDSQDYPFTDNFNVISFNGFTAGTGDVEGRAAIAKDLNLPTPGYSFGYQLRPAGVSAWDLALPFSLVVGGNAEFSNGAVYPDGSDAPYYSAGMAENILVSGSFATSDANSFTGRVQTNANAADTDSDFVAAQIYYTTLQNSFAAITPNGQVAVQYGGLTITCGDSSVTSWYFNVDGSDLSSITYYTVDPTCSLGAQYVFNVLGSGDVTFQGSNTPFAMEKTLWNIIGSGRTVNVQTEVDGSILAPQNTLHQVSGVIKGLVIVDDVTMTLQINKPNCTLPVTPATPDSMLCPSFETNCTGLYATAGTSSFSFRDFNVISFSDFTASTGDIQGRLAAQRNVNLGAGYSIGALLSTVNSMPDNNIAYSLIVGGNLTWISGALYPEGNGIPFAGAQENALVGEQSFVTEADLQSRVTSNNAPHSLDSIFANAFSCYSGYSNNLASLADNVQTAYYWSGLFVTCNDASADQYVISLSGAQFAMFTYTSTANCNFQASWVINVRGTDDVTLSGDSWPAIPGGVVYNVLGSRTINVQNTDVNGAILAPSATLNQVGGVINGKVVAGNIAMALQINRENTCSQNVTVELPIVAAVAAQQGSNSIEVDDASGYRVGDNTTLGQIISINGNTVTFSSPLNAPVSAGAFVGYDVISSVAGRAYVANPSTNSASVAAVAFAVLAIAAMIL